MSLYLWRLRYQIFKIGLSTSITLKLKSLGKLDITTERALTYTEVLCDLEFMHDTLKEDSECKKLVKTLASAINKLKLVLE